MAKFSLGKLFGKKKKDSLQNWFQLEVVEEQFPTADSKWIRLEIPKEIQSHFQWKAGQYITLNIEVEGKNYHRDYSICNLSGGDYVEICVKKTPNGTISKYLVEENLLHSTLQVSAPKGKFTLALKPNEKRTLVAFAAGSGITPIYSILQDVLKNEINAEFFLFYGNKTPDSTIFLEQIQNLQVQYARQFKPYFIYSQRETDNPLFNGRIDEQKLDLLINQVLEWDEVDEILICGPNELSVNMRLACIERGIHASQIHIELFTPIQSTKPQQGDTSSAVVALHTTLQGKHHEVAWKDFSESMLDTLLNNGVDVPYSCKGGVCGTCVCTLEGKAEMGEQLVLLDSEIKEGKFLPCVSYEAEGTVKLNFDEV